MRNEIDIFRLIFTLVRHIFISNVGSISRVSHHSNGNNEVESKHRISASNTQYIQQHSISMTVNGESFKQPSALFLSVPFSLTHFRSSSDTAEPNALCSCSNTTTCMYPNIFVCVCVCNSHGVSSRRRSVSLYPSNHLGLSRRHQHKTAWTFVVIRLRK